LVEEFAKNKVGVILEIEIPQHHASQEERVRKGQFP
jgi:hypothetical protein